MYNSRNVRNEKKYQVYSGYYYLQFFNAPLLLNLTYNPRLNVYDFFFTNIKLHKYLFLDLIIGFVRLDKGRYVCIQY